MNRTALVLVLGLLTSTVALCLLPLQVNCAVFEDQTIADQALAFITNVARIDVAKYNMTVRGPIEHFHLHGGIKTEDFKYTFESAESNFAVLMRFVNETFANWGFYFYEGYPIYTQTTPPVLEYAKEILERAQSVSGINYPVEIMNMLNSVDPASPNTTRVSSNMKFSVSLQGNNGTIEWVYIENGFEYARKNVFMKFMNGHLEDFDNYWNVYVVGDAIPVVTREEAIEKAVERANSHELTFDGVAMPFTIATDKIDAQLWGIEREPLTLQLSWHVYMNFEKPIYGVYGLEVGLWADTGEIHTFGQLVGPLNPIPTSSPPSTISPEPTPKDPQQPELDITAGAVFAVASIIVFLGLLFYFIRRK